MGTFLLILLVIIAVLYIILEPNFDHIELYCGEDWVIVWYNRYFFHRGRLHKQRDWKPLFTIDR